VFCFIQKKDFDKIHISMNYQKEVQNKLLSKKNLDRGKEVSKYMKTNYLCLGLTVPEMRNLVQTGYSFYDKSVSEVLTIWTKIISQATTFEEISQALIYYQYRKEELSFKHFVAFKKWIPFIDNWEHSDRMSDLLAILYEKYPKKMYPVYLKWNKHKNPWFRRQSIVGLLYYSSQRKKYPPFSKTISLITPLINDTDLYVQKGVGWTLRELYNVYPEKTYSYLLSHAKEIPPAGWQAATEKLSKTKKQRLMIIRKSKK